MHQRLGHRAKVTHTVIDDDDFIHDIGADCRVI
jgi:hypothetical protein